jgi:hypothetical protein
MNFYGMEHLLKMNHLIVHTPIEKMLNIKHDLIIKKKNKAKINNLKKLRNKE